MSTFKTQSLLSLVLETYYSGLAAASVKQILYKKPKGQRDAWDATVAGSTLVYDLQNGDIDQAGKWEFQAYIEVGGLKGFGSIVTKQFDTPLTV